MVGSCLRLLVSHEVHAEYGVGEGPCCDGAYVPPNGGRRAGRCETLYTARRSCRKRTTRQRGKRRVVSRVLKRDSDGRAGERQYVQVGHPSERIRRRRRTKVHTSGRSRSRRIRARTCRELVTPLDSVRVSLRRGAKGEAAVLPS